MHPLAVVVSNRSVYAFGAATGRHYPASRLFCGGEGRCVVVPRTGRGGPAAQRGTAGPLAAQWLSRTVAATENRSACMN